MSKDIKEVKDIPFAAAEDAITRVNEIEYDNSKDAPYSKWFLDNRLSCPLCGNWLTGYNGRLRTWDCTCSTWYEAVVENDTLSWTRNPKLEES